MAIDKQELVKKLVEMRDILNKMVNELDDNSNEGLDDVTNEIENGYENIAYAARLLSVMIVTEEAQKRGEYDTP